MTKAGCNILCPFFWLLCQIQVKKGGRGSILGGSLRHLKAKDSFQIQSSKQLHPEPGQIQAGAANCLANPHKLQMENSWLLLLIYWLQNHSIEREKKVTKWDSNELLANGKSDPTGFVVIIAGTSETVSSSWCKLRIMISVTISWLLPTRDKLSLGGTTQSNSEQGYWFQLLDFLGQNSTADHTKQKLVRSCKICYLYYYT